MIKRFLLEIIRVFVHTCWAFIGMIFWVPFLARVTTVFVASVLLSVSKGNSMNSAEKALNAGIIFYIEGFRKINNSMNNIINDEYTESNNIIKSKFFLADMIIEIVYTLIFWFISLSIVVKFF